VLAGIEFTAAAMAAIALVSALQAGGMAMIPAMLLISAGMVFGIVGLQYLAVSGVTEDDAGIASGAQRAADQLGGRPAAHPLGCHRPRIPDRVVFDKLLAVAGPDVVDARQWAGLRFEGWALSPIEVLIEGRQDVVDGAEGDHGGRSARDLAAQEREGVVRLCGE
jgi:hypothetical protein